MQYRFRLSKPHNLSNFTEEPLHENPYCDIVTVLKHPTSLGGEVEDYLVFSVVPLYSELIKQHGKTVCIGGKKPLKPLT